MIGYETSRYSITHRLYSWQKNPLQRYTQPPLHLQGLITSFLLTMIFNQSKLSFTAVESLKEAGTTDFLESHHQGRRETLGSSDSSKAHGTEDHRHIIVQMNGRCEQKTLVIMNKHS